MASSDLGYFAIAVPEQFSMSGHHLLALLFAAGLCSCASITAAPKVGEEELSKLTADDRGIVLIHTSLNDSTPAQVGVSLGRMESPGRYKMWRRGVPIKFGTDVAVPGQLKIPPGEYGIVGLNAIQKQGIGYLTRVYNARDAKLEGIPLTEVFDQPLAVFSVRAGEVVDIGSLQVVEGPRERTLFRDIGSFGVRIVPMPEPLLQNLAQRNPLLSAARVVRTMRLPEKNS